MPTAGNWRKVTDDLAGFLLTKLHSVAEVGGARGGGGAEYITLFVQHIIACNILVDASISLITFAYK